MVMDHRLPSVRPQSFLEWILTSFEQSLTEFYTILLEEHLERDVEGGNLFLTLVSETDQSGSLMFKSGDGAGHRRC
jgi:hypothetical protein